MVINMDEKKKKAKLATGETDVPKVKVGERYVFFKSLSDKIDDKTKQKILNSLGTHAKNTLKNIDKQLLAEGEKVSENISEAPSLIMNYLKFLKQMAEIRRENEVFFIEDQIDRLNKIKTTGALEKKINEIRNILNSSDKKMDYIKLIALLNELLLPENVLKKNIKDQLNNMKLIKKNYDALDESQQEDAREAFENQYKTYKEDFSSVLTKKIEDINGDTFLEMQDTYSKIVANKINNIIKELKNNENFLKQVEEKLNTNKNLEISSSDIYDIVLNLIIQIAEEDDIGLDALIDKAQNLTQKEIDLFLKSNLAGIFSRSSTKTLEELAMKRQSKFKGLANYVRLLSPEGKAQVFEEYDEDGTIKKLYEELEQTLNNNNISKTIYLKGRLTKKLGDAIQNKILKRIGESTSKANQNWNKIRKAAKEYYVKRTIEENLYSKITVTKIKNSGVAEIFSQEEIKNQLAGIIENGAPGTSINLKNDIVFTIGFRNPTFNFDLDLTQLNHELSQIYTSFLPTYHELGRGKTNIELAEKTYSGQVKQLFSSLEQKIKETSSDEKEQMQLLKQIKTMFLGRVSVKDYNLYNSDFGFHGGSLGGSGAPDAVINNITQMYDLGGISPIDYKTLLFAVLNCTEFTYGSSEMVDHIANYLLGGAALMMFDEGFSTTKKFLDKVKTKTFVSSSFKGIELYRLNGIYIPSSYIIETIYQNLIPVYADLAENFSLKTNIVNNSKNKVLIKTHNLSDKDIPTGEEYSTAQSRWEAISSQAIENTKIQFIFMAGMLDIFEQLNEAFNNIK